MFLRNVYVAPHSSVEILIGSPLIKNSRNPDSAVSNELDAQDLLPTIMSSLFIKSHVIVSIHNLRPKMFVDPKKKKKSIT